MTKRIIFATGMSLNKFIFRLFLPVLAIAALVSCGGTEKADPYQIFIDSAVNAKVHEHQEKLYHENDSILNALANQRADSLLKNTGKSRGSLKPEPKQTSDTVGKK